MKRNLIGYIFKQKNKKDSTSKRQTITQPFAGET